MCPFSLSVQLDHEMSWAANHCWQLLGCPSVASRRSIGCWSSSGFSNFVVSFNEQLKLVEAVPPMKRFSAIVTIIFFYYLLWQLVLSLQRMINFTFLLQPYQKYNIKQYENLIFHSLFRWKMIFLPILTTSLIHSSLKGWENELFELGSGRAKRLLQHITQMFAK